MAIVTVETPFNIELEFKLATFAQRLAGAAIDMAIVLVYIWAAETLLNSMFGYKEALFTLFNLIFVFLPVTFYKLFFEIFWQGQSPGKKILGIKVVSFRDTNTTASQYLVRWALSFGSIATMAISQYYNLFYVLVLASMVSSLPDIFSIAITSNNQRIGDLAAGTIVIDTRYQMDISETIFRKIEVSNYTVIFPDVMRLKDSDINGIRSVVGLPRHQADSQRYADDIAKKVKKHLKIDSRLNGFDFLDQLMFDYNYMSSKGV